MRWRSSRPTTYCGGRGWGCSTRRCCKTHRRGSGPKPFGHWVGYPGRLAGQAVRCAGDSHTSERGGWMKADPQELQGTWQAIRVETAAGPVPADVARQLRYQFEGGRVTLFEGERVTGLGNITVHPAVTPKA